MRKIIILAGQTQRQFAKSQIEIAPDGYAVQIAEPTRTILQNKKLWPMLADIQKQVPEMQPYTQDDIKLRFLNALGAEMRFLPEIEGAGMFPVGMKSSTLSKAQFAGLIELLYKFGAENNVRWSEPNPMERAA